MNRPSALQEMPSSKATVPLESRQRVEHFPYCLTLVLFGSIPKVTTAQLATWIPLWAPYHPKVMLTTTHNRAAIWEIKIKGKMSTNKKYTHIAKRRDFTRLKQQRLPRLTIILRVITWGHEQTFYKWGFPQVEQHLLEAPPGHDHLHTLRGTEKKLWDKAEALPQPTLWRDSLLRKTWVALSLVFRLRVFLYAHHWGSEEVYSRITSGIRFLVMDGLSEALNTPRNCETKRYMCRHFQGEGPRALGFPKGSFMLKKKKVKGPFF